MVHKTYHSRRGYQITTALFSRFQGSPTIYQIHGWRCKYVSNSNTAQNKRRFELFELPASRLWIAPQSEIPHQIHFSWHNWYLNINLLQKNRKTKYHLVVRPTCTINLPDVASSKPRFLSVTFTFFYFFVLAIFIESSYILFHWLFSQSTATSCVY